jgi:hypothetical protein
MCPAPTLVCHCATTPVPAAIAGRYPADRALKRLIEDLTARSPRFGEVWSSGDEVDHAHNTSKRKTIDHHDAGPITLDCEALDECLVPRTSASASRLASSVSGQR